MFDPIPIFILECPFAVYHLLLFSSWEKKKIINKSYMDWINQAEYEWKIDWRSDFNFDFYFTGAILIMTINISTSIYFVATFSSFVRHHPLKLSENQKKKKNHFIDRFSSILSVPHFHHNSIVWWKLISSKWSLFYAWKAPNKSHFEMVEEIWWIEDALLYFEIFDRPFSVCLCVAYKN